MRDLSFAALAAGMIVASVQASAAPTPSVRMPTSKWVVDFDESQCLASRNYGTPESPMILGLKAPPIGDIMQLMIMKPGRSGTYSEQLVGGISLDGREVLNGSMLVVPIKENTQRLTRVNLPSSLITSLSNARTMSVRVRGEMNESFQLSEMAHSCPS